MSAETVGMHMPSVVTLDDLAAMISADLHGHRYETSPEGALSVMPPPDSEHAAIASRLLVCIQGGLGSDASRPAPCMTVATTRTT